MFFHHGKIKQSLVIHSFLERNSKCIWFLMSCYILRFFDYIFPFWLSEYTMANASDLADYLEDLVGGRAPRIVLGLASSGLTLSTSARGRILEWWIGVALQMDPALPRDVSAWSVSAARRKLVS